MSETVATKTTKDKIREMFLSGQILTSCGAAQDFITADLRKYITTLKREGLDIVDRWKLSGSNKKYKEYILRQFIPKDWEITKHPDEITPALEIPAPVVQPVPVVEPAPVIVGNNNQIKLL